MIKNLIAMLRDEEGATLVEYGLIVSLIAVVAIGAITTLGNNVKIKLNSAATAVGAK